jgi:hypothetical protein
MKDPKRLDIDLGGSHLPSQNQSTMNQPIQ